MGEYSTREYKALVIGVSTGGVSALKLLLGGLPEDFPVPVIITAHIAPNADDGLALLLNWHCSLRVKEADDQEPLYPGTVYLAPANYHLLLEQRGALALSVDEPVNFARPSVDVLFESAAVAFGPALIGLIMTGAGSDGSKGLKRIKEMGGVAIVQNPEDAEADSMPRNALEAVRADYLAPLKDLAPLLKRLVGYINR